MAPTGWGRTRCPSCWCSARAGRAAAEYAATVRSASPAVQAQARTETQRLERELTRHGDGSERIADIRTEMQATLETAAGIYRDGPTLNKAVDQIRVLQERFARVGIDDHSHTFNTELTALLELSGMLDVAQTIIESALHREESRRTSGPTSQARRRAFLGAHIGSSRTDGRRGSTTSRSRSRAGRRANACMGDKRRER